MISTPYSFSLYLLLLFTHVVNVSFSQRITTKVIAEEADSTREINTMNPGTTFVSLYADGTLQSLASEPGNESGIANGSLGIIVKRGKVVWGASISVASTVDTVDSNFGNVVLNAGSGKGLASGLIDHYRYVDNSPFKWLFKIFDRSFDQQGAGYYHFYVSTSSSLWRSQNNNGLVRNANVLGSGVLYGIDIVDSPEPNSIGFGVEAGFSYRGILGDIHNDVVTDIEVQNLYKELFGTTRKHFPGLEGGLYIRFNKITAGIRGYYMFNNRNRELIDGITSFQIAGNISISSPVFTKKITE